MRELAKDMEQGNIIHETMQETFDEMEPCAHHV